MRTKPLLVLLVALAALTVFVTTAAAAPGHGPRPPSATTVTTPVPASALVPKTAATIPGATYPWVQPIWQVVDGIVIVTVPQTTVAASTQPSPWVLSR